MGCPEKIFVHAEYKICDSDDPGLKKCASLDLSDEAHQLEGFFSFLFESINKKEGGQIENVKEQMALIKKAISLVEPRAPSAMKRAMSIFGIKSAADNSIQLMPSNEVIEHNRGWRLAIALAAGCVALAYYLYARGVFH
jgi:methionyl-tRNA synthetase